MKFKCDLKSEVDRQQIFDRRFVILADTFATNEGDFVAILDRKSNALYFVSEHSAERLCSMLNTFNENDINHISSFESGEMY